MKILVLGATGMLGFALHRVLNDSGYAVLGTVRVNQRPQSAWCRGLDYLTNIEVSNFDSLRETIVRHRIDVVINATVLKTSENERQIKNFFQINSIVPRQLGYLAQQLNIRLIHFSTDSVFGVAGAPFHESDIPQPDDLYSISKFLGEPDGQNVLTLRLSMIGRALNGKGNLVDWFIAQTQKVRGYSGAIFSGMPVNEIAQLIATRLLPRLDELHGVFNLSAGPISKYDLLLLIRDAWGLQNIEIVPDDGLAVDRTLDSSKLNNLIGYTAPPWPQLVHEMREFYEQTERNGVTE